LGLEANVWPPLFLAPGFLSGSDGSMPVLCGGAGWGPVVWVRGFGVAEIESRRNTFVRVIALDELQGGVGPGEAGYFDVFEAGGAAGLNYFDFADLGHSLGIHDP